jgi:transposase
MNHEVCAHYGRLLQLSAPWEVTGVTEDLPAQRVTICVAWPKGTKVSCPVCGQTSSVYDRLEERSWRHLSIMQYLLELRCAVPRCQCPEHGVKTVMVPWAEPGSRFTFHFEWFAVKVILACHTLRQAEELLRIDWDSCQRIMDRAVARGLARRSVEQVRRVGLDEKSFLRGHSYVSTMTDMTDAKTARVLEVVRGRDLESGRKLWQSLPELQRRQVVAAAMDMSASFVAATTAEAPGCAIVHDKFHVSQMLNEAVDQTRRAEHAQLQARGDDTLKDTRYLWLKGTVPEEKQPAFSELLERNLKTARAWAYKEMFTEFWAQDDMADGRTFFDDWYRSVTRTRLDKVKKVARTLKGHLDHLLTYFAHPITNALTEGFNSRIQAIKSAARGFRRFENYRTRILFFCGKLDLMPKCPV